MFTKILRDNCIVSMLVAKENKVISKSCSERIQDFVKSVKK